MNSPLLIIDDSEIDRSKYIRYLSQDIPCDYLVLEASTIEEAQNLCEVNKPVVILLGLQLTNGKGLEFLDWMRRKQEISMLPTLLLVKQTEESIASKAIKMGLQDYLVKDYLTPERLRRSVENLLERIHLINTVCGEINSRKRAEQLMTESTEKFRLFEECSDDLIWSSDLENKFNYLSPQLQELFGWESTECLGKDMIEFVHVSDRPRFRENIEQILICNQKTDLPIEFRFLQKDGSYVWVSCNMISHRNSLGLAVSIQGILRDISDRIALASAISDRSQVESRLKDTNETLSVINQDLLQAIGLKDKFLSTMSHELRTPLSGILGLTEILQEFVYGSLNDEQLNALKIIESSGNHLLGLINDILDFSKSEVGCLELNRTANSITQLCQSSLDFVKYQAANKNIQLKIDIGDNLPEVFLDDRRMRQALIHLLNNAIKFTPPSGQVTLTVRATAESWIQITVSDTGIGISPENMNKLFLPFVQVDGNLNRQYEGAGLGLALVKQIIDSHGGKVSVNSEVGVGSCFTVNLPIT